MEILQHFVEFILANGRKQQYFAKFIFANREKYHKIEFFKN